jgi:hypothetical protein
MANLELDGIESIFDNYFKIYFKMNEMGDVAQKGKIYDATPV